jgi:hypothetical protein
MGGPESICVVTPTHPWADSGVEPGPFVAQLIDNLVWTHGRVSVLLPNIPHGAPPFTLARERAKAAGVDLHCLFWPQGADQSSAYAVHRWLSKSRFTHVLFVDSGGLGYWAISAKWQGIDHARRSLGVVAAAPSEVVWRERGELMSGPENMQRVFMERRSAKLADFVLAPTADLAAYYREERLGSSPVISMPMILGPAVHDRIAARKSEADAGVTRICFAGALDSLYGLEQFCAALDGLRLELPPASAQSLSVAFLGRRGRLVNGDDGGLFALTASRRWPGPVDLIPEGDLDSDLAMALEPGTVLVAASPAAARSTLVRIAASAGVRTVVPEASLAQFEGAASVVGFAPSARSLAAGMRTALAARPGRPAAPAMHALADLLPPREERAQPAPPVAAPKVSVCIAYFNRPHLLEQAIDSLRRQTYPNVEVVLVDDASPSAESQAYTASL